MAPLGPFGPAPRLAAGVSGGPHSLCLALLAAEWARARGGALLALVADHGLRPDSGAEAEGVAAALAARGIAARVLRLGLSPGPGMQERARAARLDALLAACAAAGAPWLLLGHHRADQAETLLQRAAAGSGPTGLAGMAPLRATPQALVLRPLLGLAPARLEATLAARGAPPPVRDPSNADPRFARARLRAALSDPGGEGPEVAALAAAAAAFGARRARAGEVLAARLAGSGTRLHPEGWAELDLPALGGDAVAEAALAALVRAVGGGGFAPAPDALAALRARGEGTLAGAWLRRRPGRAPGWVLLREPAAALAAPPVAARTGAVWDGRFRLAGPGAEGHVIAALGPAAAARLRRAAPPGMPAAALAALPALRPAAGGDCVLAVVPSLIYPDPAAALAARFAMVFAPATGSVTSA